MPLQHCTTGGKAGWRWGNAGKCYTGPGAKRCAVLQGVAIERSITGNQRNPLRLDPTRTSMLRRSFEAEVAKRFNLLKRKIWALIVTEDALGLSPQLKSPLLAHRAGSNGSTLAINARWQFHSNEQKLLAFQGWIRTRVEADMFVAAERSIEDAYWFSYIEQGYRKGAARAFDDTRKVTLWTGAEGEFYRGTKEEFLRSAFARPVAIEKVRLLARRAYGDLKGVTDVMGTQLGRQLIDGLVEGASPRTIARRINKSIDNIGRTRSRTIARTEIIRAHAEGQLDALEQLGVEDVGVMVEWDVTAGACLLCASMGGTVLKVKEARGLIPRHPNCKCVFIPANVGESTIGQKRSQADIRKSIDQSIRAEMPKRSLQLVVDSPEFKEWFRGSKVVDRKGNPLLMFRGTSGPKLSAYGGPKSTNMVFVSSDREFAARYAAQFKGGRVHSLYVKSDDLIDISHGDGYLLWKRYKTEMDVPSYASVSTRDGMAVSWQQERPFRAWLDRKGIKYDGIYFGENDGSRSLAVRSIKQVRPAKAKLVGTGRTLAEQKARSTWAGADRGVAKVRPKSVLAPVTKPPVARPKPLVKPVVKKPVPRPEPVLKLPVKPTVERLQAATGLRDTDIQRVTAKYAKSRTAKEHLKIVAEEMERCAVGAGKLVDYGWVEIRTLRLNPRSAFKRAGTMNYGTYHREFHSIEIAAGRLGKGGPLQLGKQVAEATGRGTVRHEYGHAVYQALGKRSSAAVDEWATLVRTRTQVGWARAVSQYGSTNNSELFAECFSAWTHPEYAAAKRRLPKEVEQFFIKHLGG